MIILSVAISMFMENDVTGGFECIGLGILFYTFLATMILNNTFITDMWIVISSWGVIKLPGIIFGLSLDGFIFFLAIKLCFFIIGLMVSIAAMFVATIIAMVFSVFVYPYALFKNIKNIVNED
jgi:hypothetical protein